MKGSAINRVTTLLLVILITMVPLTPAAAQTVTPPNQIFLPQVNRSGAGPQVTYEVAYQDNATVIDEQTLSSKLKSVSQDKVEYRFDSSAEAVSALQPGEVVIFSGLALRKIVAVSTTADEIVLQTEEATLNQAIRDGTIAWTLPVNWMELPESVYAATTIGNPGSDFQVTEMYGFDHEGLPVWRAASPPYISYEGTIQGWEVKLKLTLGVARLDIDLSASYSVGSGNAAAKASVSGKGWISTFVQETQLTYAEGTPTNISVKSSGLDGEMELKWAAVKPGVAALTEIASFSIPVAVPIPIQAGPLLAILSVKANLQMVPEMRVDQASSGGSYKFTYNSDQGFTAQNNLASGVGQLNSVEIGLSGDTASAGYGSVGFGLGVEFPRLELSVLGIGVAFITIKTYATSLFLLEPPCQKGTGLLLAVAGYKLTPLGFTVAEEEKELWRKEFTKYLDDIPCDQSAAALSNPVADSAFAVGPY